MHIVHVASVEITPNSGMGRIAFEWKKAFEKEGHQFTHIGWKELKKTSHPLLFGWLVRRFIINNNIKPDIILAHEPTAGFLVFKKIPLVVFSHGIEERGWICQKAFKFSNISFKANLIPVVLRFWSNNYGFRNAKQILLSNYSDQHFLVNKKKISGENIFIFKNGYNKYILNQKNNSNVVGCLFNASWIERKGIELLTQSFNQLLVQFSNLRLFIAGTGLQSTTILSYFLQEVQSQIHVYPKFSDDTEVDIYKDSKIFLLPSFFEGQSLALTQAMYMGLCPVVSDNCGQLDFIEHNVNGLHIETGSVDSLIKSIVFLLNNPELINQMGMSASEYVKELEWSSVSKQVVDKVIAAKKRI